MRGGPLGLSARLDPTELRRYEKKLAKNMGKPLLERAERLTHAAARFLVPIGRRLAPIGEGRIIRGELVQPGKLRAGIKPKKLRRRGFEPIRPTWFGTGAWYAHFVAFGTRSHDLTPREQLGKSEYAAFDVDVVRPFSAFPTIRGAQANDWVQEVWREGQDDYRRVVDRDIFITR